MIHYLYLVMFAVVFAVQAEAGWVSNVTNVYCGSAIYIGAGYTAVSCQSYCAGIYINYAMLRYSGWCYCMTDTSSCTTSETGSYVYVQSANSSLCTFSAPTNGLLGTCTGSIAVGSSCSFTCNSGYQLSATSQVCSTYGNGNPTQQCFKTGWVSNVTNVYCGSAIYIGAGYTAVSCQSYCAGIYINYAMLRYSGWCYCMTDTSSCTTSETGSYVYTAAPIISRITPTSGSVGTVLTVYGVLFGSSASTLVKVTVGGAACPIVMQNATTIVCTAPTGEGLAKAVYVTNLRNQLTSTQSVGFTYARVTGDPLIVGFLGQSFYFHGLPDSVFTLFSCPRLHMNGKLTLLQDGESRDIPTIRWHLLEGRRRVRAQSRAEIDVESEPTEYAERDEGSADWDGASASFSDVSFSRHRHDHHHGRGDGVGRALRFRRHHRMSTPRLTRRRQINDVYRYNDKGDEDVEAYPDTKSWTHPGTYFSSLGFRFFNSIDNAECTLIVIAGAYEDGLTVFLNGTRLHASSHGSRSSSTSTSTSTGPASTSISKLSMRTPLYADHDHDHGDGYPIRKRARNRNRDRWDIEFKSPRELLIHTPFLRLQIHNADYFINIDAADVSFSHEFVRRHQVDGLLGATCFNSGRKSEQKEYKYALPQPEIYYAVSHDISDAVARDANASTRCREHDRDRDAHPFAALLLSANSPSAVYCKDSKHERS